ncbi:MAG: hypothetical protein ISQ08_04285 [Planctomycetes bacterium]|nr:hypothetical protein [Planctomycetota bacterium]MDA0947764.1 hypothetical protein [Planctomycetota bacterium]
MRFHSRTGASSASPLLAAFAVAAVAILGAGILASGSKERGLPPEAVQRLDEARTKPDPFDDSARSVPKPAATGPGGGAQSSKGYDASPADLLSEPDWVRAKELAAQADALMEEAAAAEAAGNNALFLEKAVAARTRYEEAAGLVVDWELDIRNEYGDGDVKVRVIVREITRWAKAIRKYRKLSGGSEE